MSIARRTGPAPLSGCASVKAAYPSWIRVRDVKCRSPCLIGRESACEELSASASRSASYQPPRHKGRGRHSSVGGQRPRHQPRAPPQLSTSPGICGMMGHADGRGRYGPAGGASIPRGYGDTGFQERHRISWCRLLRDHLRSSRGHVDVRDAGPALLDAGGPPTLSAQVLCDLPALRHLPDASIVSTTGGILILQATRSLRAAVRPKIPRKRTCRICSSFRLVERRPSTLELRELDLSIALAWTLMAAGGSVCNQSKTPGCLTAAHGGTALPCLLWNGLAEQADAQRVARLVRPHRPPLAPRGGCRVPPAPREMG